MKFWPLPDLATRLQLERDELLVLCFHGGMHPNVVRAAVSVRTAEVDGCGLQRLVAEIRSEKKCYGFSDLRASCTRADNLHTYVT